LRLPMRRPRFPTILRCRLYQHRVIPSSIIRYLKPPSRARNKHFLEINLRVEKLESRDCRATEKKF
jgi:hypothetical protein